MKGAEAMIETTAETLAETKYYEYWGLHRPPFDNVPDPSMYVDCHASMESAVAETLFAIEEGDECISVIVGDVGLGKTLTIRLIIDLLEQEKYKIALITNPGITFIQVLQEIIGQLKGKQCEEKRKVNLLEAFNKLLFSTLEEGKKILIFIDECNAISPENLENLRLLTNMQGDGRNLFTMVLAGQIEFAKRLEHPSRANLFQRVGTYCKITRFESVSVVTKYVESRLKLSGATRQIFADDAFNKIWENSDGGVPRLINKLCKLCLKAGETNGLSSIRGEVVDQIGSRFNKMTRPNVQRRLPTQIPGKALSSAAKEPNSHKVIQDIDRASEGYDKKTHEEVSSLPQEDSAEGRVIDRTGDLISKREEIASFIQQENVSIREQNAEQTLPDEGMGEGKSLGVQESVTAKTNAPSELEIHGCRIKIDFPEDLLKQSKSSTVEYRFKMAGMLAAEALKNNSHLITSYTVDPVPIWQEIRDYVLNRFNQAEIR
jgi:type II secretory pathway predicted ATPase ExeA